MPGGICSLIGLRGAQTVVALLPMILTLLTCWRLFWALIGLIDGSTCMGGRSERKAVIRILTVGPTQKPRLRWRRQRGYTRKGKGREPTNLRRTPPPLVREALYLTRLWVAAPCFVNGLVRAGCGRTQGGMALTLGHRCPWAAWSVSRQGARILLLGVAR